MFFFCFVLFCFFSIFDKDQLAKICHCLIISEGAKFESDKLKTNICDSQNHRVS